MNTKINNGRVVRLSGNIELTYIGETKLQGGNLRVGHIEIFLRNNQVSVNVTNHPVLGTFSKTFPITKWKVAIKKYLTYSYELVASEAEEVKLYRYVCQKIHERDGVALVSGKKIVGTIDRRLMREAAEALAGIYGIDIDNWDSTRY